MLGGRSVLKTFRCADSSAFDDGRGLKVGARLGGISWAPRNIPIFYEELPRRDLHPTLVRISRDIFNNIVYSSSTYCTLQFLSSLRQYPIAAVRIYHHDALSSSHPITKMDAGIASCGMGHKPSTGTINWCPKTRPNATACSFCHGWK